MGLTTTHGCWDAPYSTFNRFRYSLASQIGINLDEYNGYGDGVGHKKLESIKHDIGPLLNHSDCDGSLTVNQCKKIANGLNDILNNFNDTIDHDFNFKDQISRFREGLLLAVVKNEVVRFR